MIDKRIASRTISIVYRYIFNIIYFHKVADLSPNHWVYGLLYKVAPKCSES